MESFEQSRTGHAGSKPSLPSYPSRDTSVAVKHPIHMVRPVRGKKSSSIANPKSLNHPRADSKIHASRRLSRTRRSPGRNLATFPKSTPANSWSKSPSAAFVPPTSKKSITAPCRRRAFLAMKPPAPSSNSALAWKGFRVGERVGLHLHHIPCLKCHYCEHRAFAQCPGYKRTGITAGFEPAGGGYAEIRPCHAVCFGRRRKNSGKEQLSRRRDVGAGQYRSLKASDASRPCCAATR